MKAFHWKVAGLCVLGMLALLALGCAVENGPFRSCMRAEAFGTIAAALHIGAMAIGIWAGVEAESAWKRSWLSIVVGTIAWLALAGLLTWLGFYGPRGSLGEY